MVSVSVLTLTTTAIQANAQVSLQGLQTNSINELEQGALLLRAKDSAVFHQAPEVATDVTMDITGMFALVIVKQQFTNPTTEWLNGIYVFPLPDNAAVFGLKMHIGDQIIEGQIKERKQARRIYKKARDSGRKASLVEQERPNIFTTSLANIAPGERITIELQYQQTLDYNQNMFSIRFPMVVATRYIPGSTPIKGFSGTGWAINTNQVPDAQRISPPVTDPKRTSDSNKVSINIQLDAGFPVSSLKSAYHTITQTSLGANRYHIKLSDDASLANRDFVLSWEPKKGEAPQGALFTQNGKGTETYGLLMVMPQRDDIGQAAILPREIVYVIDTSGSMAGESMIQAKQAVRYSLNHLQAHDTFRIIEFSSHPTAMHPVALTSSTSNINRAKRFVDQLQANGGTEVASALALAFSHGTQNHAPPNSILRQIVLLTDGSIGNESDLFKLINDRLNDSRLFTIGIGSSPNSYFMREAAKLGRGSFTYIGDTSEVRDKMVQLFDKMASPVLSDISLHWPGLNASEVEVWPNPIPDVYLGEPIIVSMKFPDSQTELSLKGTRAGSEWSLVLPTKGRGKASGLDRLWASHKLQSLAHQQRLSSTPEEYQGIITDLALEHHLLSKYTSLVAVDVSPAQKPASASENRNIPVLNPHGNSGMLPQTATAAQLNILLGLIMLLLYGGFKWMGLRRTNAQ